MGLSYSLDVESLQNMNKLSEVLINYGEIPFFDSTFFGARFTNSSGNQDIYPTGEYVIRKGMYINGYFVYVGSYKAYCLDLFGAGNHGYAWDGFIMTLKGYNFNQSPTVIEYNPILNKYLPGFGFGFLPMRMMYEVNCGVIGDASDIADDSSVGLYGLDIYKSLDDFGVNDADRDIKIITCGFQRINPSAESVPTGSDYIGNLYLGRLLKFDSVNDNNVNYTTQIFGSLIGDDFMQVTWRANQVNHVDKTFAGDRFSLIMDLDESLGVIQEVAQAGGVIWSYGEWFAGNTPSTQKLAKTVKVFPRKFTDITCVSQQPYSATQQADSVWILTGDSSLDVNNDGTIDKTVPHTTACAFPYYDFISGIRATQPPFMNMNPSGATSLSDVTTYRWQLEDTTPSYNLDSSVSVFSSQPYEALDLTPPYVTASYPETMVALNNVSYDGNTYGSIYSVLGSLLQPSFVMMPYAVQGGSFTTATGIDLPSQWYGKAVQFRTFTIAEENIAKQGTFGIDTGEFTPTSNSVYDFDTEEYIGWISNYQRYGAFNLENPSVEPSASAGQLTGSGYGFLGFKTGTGSIAIMFDSGSPYYDDSVFPPTHTLVVREEGSNLSANVIDTPSSATRKVINCGWDNDRDQWLFILSDTNQVSIVSASSDFNTDSNNVGFLDQTANFTNKGLTLNTDAGLYTPITMSNALDGWVFFGDLDSSIFGIKNASIGSATTINKTVPSTFSYDVYYSATTDVYRIVGTTGRTARVWVDYVLFDGVDSVIASKLKNLGMKVNIENVEWFKRKIIRTGDLNIKSEEIEEWVRQQQQQYKDMLKAKERQGRIRKKKSQVSAYREGMEEQINPDFMTNEEKDFLNEFIPQDRPPSPTEKKLEKKRKGGYEPKQSSYYDEVFEDEP